MARDEMQRVRSGIQKIAVDIFGRLPKDEAAILAWPLVCGAGVAKRTRALRFVSGTLEIQVPDRGWRSQLSDFSAQYASSINALLKTRLIERIEYVVADVERRPAQKLQ
jgi:hypothetical protein